MRVYKSKEELKAEINKTFDKYISEFDCIPEALKDKRVDEVDRTRQKTLPIRWVGQHWFLNGRKMKGRGFK